MGKKILIFKVLFLFMSVILNSKSYAQNCYEKEDKIKEKKVPYRAKKWIESLSLKRVKWFIEQDCKEILIEAQVNIEHEKCNIEFDTLGYFLVLEQHMNFLELKDSIRFKITHYFEAHYPKFKVLKTQKHWINSNNVNQEKKYWGAHLLSPYLYELTLSCKKDGQFLVLDVLISLQGNFITEEEIILSIDENLEY